MTRGSIPGTDIARAQEALGAMRNARVGGTDREAALSIGDASFVLPGPALAALEVVLALLAAGRDIAVFPEVVSASDRPRCLDCGEPVVLADPVDAESWVHAPDANDLADHTAQVEYCS